MYDFRRIYEAPLLNRWFKTLQFKTTFLLTKVQFVTDMTKINDTKVKKNINYYTDRVSKKLDLRGFYVITPDRIKHSC